jgi:hypothetical protein
VLSSKNRSTCGAAAWHATEMRQQTHRNTEAVYDT